MVYDILYNEDGTFREKDGDILFGNAEAYLMEDILLASPGHYKEFPTLGGNVLRFTNSRSNIQVISREVKVSLQADVFKKPVLDFRDFPSTIYIDNLELNLVPDGV